MGSRTRAGSVAGPRDPPRPAAARARAGAGDRQGRRTRRLRPQAHRHHHHDRQRRRGAATSRELQHRACAHGGCPCRARTEREGQLLGGWQLRTQRPGEGQLPRRDDDPDHGAAARHGRAGDLDRLARRRRAVHRRRVTCRDLLLHGPRRAIGRHPLRRPGGDGLRGRHRHGGRVLVRRHQRRRAREHDDEDGHLPGRRRQGGRHTAAGQQRREPADGCDAALGSARRRRAAGRGDRRACRDPGRATRRRVLAETPGAEQLGADRQGARSVNHRLQRRGAHEARKPGARALRPAIQAGADRRDPRRGVHAAAARHGRRRARARARRWWCRRRRVGRRLRLRLQGQGLQPPGQLRLRGRRRRAARRRRGGRRDRRPVAHLGLAGHADHRRGRRRPPGAVWRPDRRCSRA